MRALQLIYSFFLGLAVAAFVGVGLDTFYPAPDYPTLGPEKSGVEPTPEYRAREEAFRLAQDAWNLNTSIVLLVVATGVLVVALLLGARLVVLSNGLLLGGLFTMVYAVGRSASQESVLRFVVIATALLVTIAVGWFKFVRTPAAARGPDGAPAGVVDPNAVGDPTAAADLERRVTALEHRLESLRRAFRD